ncbi:hypothetical protein ACQ4PT_035828 [Festuca glaucescens]
MSGKKVADVAVKAGRAIDWDGMAKMLVSEEARKEFATPPPHLRGRQPPAPDQVLAGIEIPKYVDTVTPEYKPKFDALVVELKEAEKTSLKESERIEKEIVELREMKKKISTMTADEYFEKHPELKKKFDDEIRNDYWGY